MQQIKARGKRNRGFTLIEVMVASVLVAVGVVGVMGAIASTSRSQAKAQTADLLQRLAQEKLNDIELLSTPTANGSSGDFSDRGYPNIQWNLDDEASGVTNVDTDTVTVTRGADSQALTTMVYIPPQSAGTTTGTGATP